MEMECEGDRATRSGRVGRGRGRRELERQCGDVCCAGVLIDVYREALHRGRMAM